MSHNRLLTPIEASGIIHVATNTLAKWRVSGNGPCFLKIGSRIFYQHCDLDAWLASCRRSSTSETANPQASEGKGSQ